MRSLITLKALTFLPDRWNCGGAYHLASRVARRREELGLSLLLGARRDINPALASGCGIPRRSAGVARVAFASRCGKSFRTQYCVRSSRRAEAYRTGTAVAARIRTNPRRCEPATPPTNNFNWTFLERWRTRSFSVGNRDWDLPEDAGEDVAEALLEFLETGWDRPDEGIWEMRGPRRHFVHSKMMAWVAVDRAIRSVEQGWFSGDIDRWRTLRDTIHQQVCEQGFDASLNSFVQYYGSKHLDASILMMPLVGFLPADDARVVGTVKAIETHLMENGFVARYTQDPAVDGMPHGEGMFLACSFWLADNYCFTESSGRCGADVRSPVKYS